jgi:hypothetical protein
VSNSLKTLEEQIDTVSLFDGIGHRKKRAFLIAFTMQGTVLKAAETARVKRTAHYHWLKTDPEYAEAFEEAERLSADLLADEAFRRAVEGVKKPIYHKGEVVGYETVYSDVLLMFLAKARNRQKYDDRAAAGVPPEINIKVSIPEELRRHKIIDAEVVPEGGGE